MKRASLLCVAAAALWAAACSGNGTTITPPPPNNGFSNSDLSGQYAFSMTGTTFNAQSLVTEPYTRVGSFIADGKGGISGGVEDVNVAGASNEFAFTAAGSGYTINSDGRGSITLVDSSGTLTFDVVLTSSSSGYIVDFPSDASSTASGNFALQNTASFTLSGVSGSYTFDLSGSDPNGNPESIVGEFQANGTGQFPTGQVDDNDGGQINGGTPGPAAISGTYAAPSTSPSDLTSFGRCQFTIGSLSGVLYIVGPNQVKFMEETSGGTLAGDAFLQSNIPKTTAGINGGFVYVMGGAGLSGSGISGPLTRGGKFATSGGNLTLTSVIVDSNNAGSPSSLNTAATGSYTIDSAGTGRGTITFTISGQKNAFQYVFYLISPTQGVIQDQSLAIVSDGSLLAQGSGSITNSSLAGNYGISWSGVTVVDGNQGEEDLLGEATLSSAAAITGTVDFNEFASNKLPQQANVGLTGMLKLSGDGTGHNSLTFNLATNPANDGITAFAYVANNNTILFMAQGQSIRVAAGVMTPQNP